MSICRRSRLLSREPKLAFASAPTFAPSFAAAGWFNRGQGAPARWGYAQETSHFGVSRTYSGRAFRHCDLSGCTHRAKLTLRVSSGTSGAQRVARAFRIVKGVTPERSARPGRLGPKLAPSRFDCRPYVAQRNAGRAVEEPVDANGVGWCNPLNENGPMVAGVMVTRRAGPVSVLAQRLQPYVDRPILDATGLSGNFEWDVRYAFRPAAPADFPTLFTALQEQLGLKLEPRQAPVEVLVVDHVELPTPD